MKSVQTISNALSQMSKAGILKRIETGVYALNPLLFGKGDWRDIQALRLKVDYTLQGKTFKAFLNYKKRGEINITPKPEQLEEGKGGSLNDGNGTAEESGASS